MSDGDTVEVDVAGRSLTVRLAGINAPEVGECHSDAAQDRLRRLEGSQVGLEVVGEDQFGRQLAHVFADGIHVNLEMVASGEAIATTPADGDRFGGDLVNAEATASGDQIGLWAGGACRSEGEMPEVDFDRSASRVDPSGPDETALDREYVVIINESGGPVDLSGWILRDESSRHRFRFPLGSALPAGGSLPVLSADPGWSPGGSPVWNNEGDMALLQDPSGTVVGRWRY